MYDHLGLSRWPFTVVPECGQCTFIADREQFQNDLNKLLRSLSRQNASSIHPMWSWFGAGKTHTLYYLSNRAAQLRECGQGHLTTLYSEFPQNARSFVDVYKSVALQLEQRELTETFLEIHTSPQSSALEQELFKRSPDLLNALKVLVFGTDSDQETAMRWIRAESVSAADCRKIRISKKISTSAESSEILVGLIKLFGLCAVSQTSGTARFVWLLDELQRINKGSKRVREEINTGLHSTFNACPTGFSMILSFSGHPSAKLPDWFSPELKDRMGRTRVLILPPMQPSDALCFVRDVLAHARPSDLENVEPYFPFSEQSCCAIIENVQAEDELKPRAIMQAFNAVLQDAEFEIESGNMPVVTVDFARSVLAELA